MINFLLTSQNWLTLVALAARRRTLLAYNQASPQILSQFQNSSSRINQRYHFGKERKTLKRKKVIFFVANVCFGVICDCVHGRINTYKQGSTYRKWRMCTYTCTYLYRYGHNITSLIVQVTVKWLRSTINHETLFTQRNCTMWTD